MNKHSSNKSKVFLTKFFLKYKEDIGQGEKHHDDTHKVTVNIDHVNVDSESQPMRCPLSHGEHHKVRGNEKSDKEASRED